jgi:hypothetical protein
MSGYLAEPAAIIMTVQGPTLIYRGEAGFVSIPLLVDVGALELEELDDDVVADAFGKVTYDDLLAEIGVGEKPPIQDQDADMKPKEGETTMWEVLNASY